MMNRIRDVVRHVNEGIPFTATEEKKEEKDFSKEYNDKNLPKLIEKMLKEKKLTDEEHEYLLKALELAKKASSLEQSHKGPMGKFSSRELIWTEFMEHVPGIGVVLASRLLTKFGHCEKYESVSSLWRHCGFHLVCPKCTEEIGGQTFSKIANNLGTCSKCGLNGVTPRRKKGQKSDFDPSRKTLAWNVGDCLIKQKSPVYYDIYFKEKERQLQRDFPPGKLRELYGDPYKNKDVSLSLGHAHGRAARKMIKIFLQHYWSVGRHLVKLPLTDPYVQNNLKHTHIVTWQDVLRANGVEPSANGEL
jgi:predicted RNA-binding Zn-ribbon protein involved in translation (DUF1610 family)